MAAVAVRLRSELRARWRAWLGLALLLGLAGGAAIAAAAGARRTDTAYPRFVVAQKGFDLQTGGFPDGVDAAKGLVTIERLPEVAEWARIDVMSFAGILPSGNLLTAPQLIAGTDLQGRLGIEFSRFKVLSGRLFDLDAPDEAVVDFGTADLYGLRLGSVLRFVIGDLNAPSPKLAPVRIMGIVASPGGFPAVGISSFFTTVYVTPAFARANGVEPDPANAGLLIRLKRGAADIQPFLRDLSKTEFGDVDIPLVEKVQTAGIQRSIRFESQALWALAVLVGLSALAILGQSLARQTYLDSDELPTLRAIGMSRRQLAGLGMARAGAIGVVAALAAAPVAVLLSPLTPIGLARLAEPDPGVRVDAAALAVGSVLILVLTVAATALPAIRAARAGSGSREADRERPSALARVLGRASSSPARVVGLRMALEPGRGRTAVPIRSAIFGATLSVVALTASLLFASSLHHVLTTPSLSGTTWDAFVADEEDPAATAAALRGDPLVDGYSRGGFTNVQIGGVSLFALTIGPTGPAHPVIVEGRSPSAPDEVALGAGTLHAIHASIGDTIPVVLDQAEAPPPPVRMKVVGIVIMPQAPFGVSRPGEGAAITTDGYRRLDPSAGPDIRSPFLVRFRSGTSPDAGFAAMRKDSPSALIVPAERQGAVSSLSRISDVPLLLAALLAALALGTLGHTLVTATRRRRRDLAILKTVGFVRRQIAGAVAWQAITLTASALLIGIPVGIAGGRWAWRLFAEQLGVLPVPVVPLVALALTVPSALILANLIAALPGRSAARTQPARILRAE